MNELVKQYQLTKNKEILEKIILNSKNLIDSILNYYSKNKILNLSKEELYDYAVEGIIIASNNYKFIGKTFLEYANICIERVFYKLLKRSKFPERLFEKFLEVKDMIEKKYKTTLEENPSLLDTILEEMADMGLLNLIDYNEAKEIINNRLTTWILKRNTIKITPDNLDLDYLTRLLHATLNDLEYDCFISYYGIFNDKETLTKIATRNNITHQAVFLNCKNAIKKVGRIFALYNSREKYYFNIDKIITILEKLLTKEELNYLIDLFGLFGRKKKTLEEMGTIYHINTNTISLKVGISLEKISFIINHLNLVTINKFNNIYQLFKDNLTEEEFTLFLNYYGLFGNPKKSILELKDIYSISTLAIKKKVENLNKKIKLLITCNNQLEFLRNILNKNEIEILEANYLYKSVDEKPNRNIEKVFEMIITKLNILYDFKNYQIDKVNFLNFLNNLLTSKELNDLSMRFGLLNHSRYSKDLESLYRITLNDRKILEQIAICLNIENNTNKRL